MSIRFPASRLSCAGQAPAATSASPWAISQEINCSSATEFNHAARNSLAGGLNALNMVLDQATRNGHDPDWAKPDEVGWGGLSIATVNDLDRALDGIDLEKTFLLIRSGASAMPIAALLAALTRRRKKTLTALRGCIEMDPLGGLVPRGLSAAISRRCLSRNGGADELGRRSRAAPANHLRPQPLVA